MFDHFNFLAPFYDRIIKVKEGDPLGDLLELPVSGWLLDAGGGTGRVAGTIVEKTGHLVVSDISRGMLRQAQKKSLATVETPTEYLPFPSNFFERIIMVDALHHVEEQDRTAGELWRVLAPGGSILIVEPDIRQAVVKWIAIFEKIALMRSHFLSPAAIAALFDAPNAGIRQDCIGTTAWIRVEKRL